MSGQLQAILRRQLDGGSGQTEIISFEDQSFDRNWLRDVASQVEAALATVGIADDTAIGFAPMCRPEWVAALSALIAAGRPIAMVHAYQSPAATAAQLRSKPRAVLIAGPHQWNDESIAAARENGTVAICLRMQNPFVEVLNAPAEPLHLPEPERGIAFLTSGTTGAPKSFPISYDRMFERMVKGTAFGASADRKPLLSFFPPSNISGIYTLLPVLAAGNPLVLLERFDAENWARFVEIWRPQTMGLPVAGLRMILDAQIEPARLASLTHVSSGASALPGALRMEFEAYCGIPVLEAYGATEFGGVVAAMSLAERLEIGDAIAGSAGRALPGFTFRITDPTSGAVLSAENEGRLEVLSSDSDGQWIQTTDLAKLDVNGYLFCCGRLDGVISRGGFKIVPEQVSAALQSHPDVIAAAVVGLQNDRLGELPAAIVELRSGSLANAESLTIHARSILPSPAVPSLIAFVDSMPRTISLKPDLTAVRKLLEVEQGASRC